MKTRVWPMLADKIHANTIITGMAWSWVEPEEGKYDFSIADAAIENAKQHNMRICWMWFASWKNGLSSFAPTWVKANQERFPRAQILDGKTVEVLSTLSEKNRNADAKAFAALMRHCREVDTTHRVIMVQVENEVGLGGDSRDRSPLANAAFAKPVPAQLMDYIQKNKENLQPEFRKVWEAAGSKTSGTWEEVFGKGPKTDEIFMGWNYAQLPRLRRSGRQEGVAGADVHERVARSGRRQRTGRLSERRTGGGCARHVACGCSEHRPPGPGHSRDQLPRLRDPLHAVYGNPLFTPEERADPAGVADAFYAYGHFRALGHSVIGIDSVQRLQGRGVMGAAPGRNPATARRS